MICRVAESADWEQLSIFFKEIYRQKHPLQTFEFWDWQFGKKRFGRSFIVDNGGKIAGHVGATFNGGYAWIINVYLSEECRGKGMLRELYSMAKEFAPIAAANINEAGLNLYRNMGYIRYCDLQRFVAINPKCKDPLKEIKTIPDFPKPQGHFFMQPGIEGIILPDESCAVKQLKVGGLRIVSMGNPQITLEKCWELDIGWVDYITSWNDPICRILDSSNLWINGDPIPWNLDPIERGTVSRIAYVSEKPMPDNFIVKRTYSDISRIGSL